MTKETNSLEEEVQIIETAFKNAKSDKEVLHIVADKFTAICMSMDKLISGMNPETLPKSYKLVLLACFDYLDDSADEIKRRNAQFRNRFEG